ESDNVACDKLLALVGGPDAVTTLLRELQLPGIDISHSELDLARGTPDNTATPIGMVRLLEKMQRQELGLSASSAALLASLMTRTQPGARRLKGNLPPGTPVAHRTGTSGPSRRLRGRSEATNDVGLVTLPDRTHVAIAVFVHDSPGDDAMRERTIAELA